MLIELILKHVKRINTGPQLNIWEHIGASYCLFSLLYKCLWVVVDSLHYLLGQDVKKKQTILLDKLI